MKESPLKSTISEDFGISGQNRFSRSLPTGKERSYSIQAIDNKLVRLGRIAHIQSGKI